MNTNDTDSVVRKSGDSIGQFPSSPTVPFGHETQSEKSDNSPNAPTIIANQLGMGKMYKLVKITCGRTVAILILAILILASSLGSFAMWFTSKGGNFTAF